jgi:branched-chain amino acid transport system permease protein
MVQSIIAGLVLGGVYALAASGIVITYVSTGILNFAFGAMAFAVARFYYFLEVQHDWSNVTGGLVSILLVGPLLGLALYYALFRFLRQSTTVTKVVATIGLSVALPAAATWILGNQPINIAPGLAHRPVRVVHVAGVPVTLDQIIVYGSVVVVLLVGVVVLRFTEVGLTVRAMVDSEALTSIAGVKPDRVLVGVWTVSGLMAGLAGVLVAPVIGLTTADFSILAAGALAAVLAARLRSLSIAVVVGLAMGVVGAVIQNYVPTSSSYATAIVPSIPFAVIVVALIYFVARSGTLTEGEGLGGALDRAIRVQASGQVTETGSSGVSHGRSAARSISTGAAWLAIVAILPLVLHGSWVGLVGEGLAFAVAFLSFTLITGEGGMIWLCEISFAGIGAIVAAQLATDHGWPILAGIVAGGLVAGVLGAIVGCLTIKLGDLYVALATLAFALLVDNVVYTRPSVLNDGAGVIATPPHFLLGTKAFDYFMIGVVAVIWLIVDNLRRSTTGLALNAVRGSVSGAVTSGVRPLYVKVLAAAVAAIIAGIGGGLLATWSGVAIASSFTTFTGLIWLAVLVTAGVRSNQAALVAGMSFAFIPTLFVEYLPKSLAQLPTILFGLGAIAVARNPDGIVAMHAGQIRNLPRLIGTLRARRAQPGLTPAVLSSVPASTVAVATVEHETGTSATSKVVSFLREGTRREKRTLDGRSEPAALRAENVRVNFGGLIALDNVSIEVGKGRTVGLLGPNGAGKTTLFGVLSGLLRPSSGAVYLDGVEVTTASPQERVAAGMGRTFQHPELFPGLTVREHLVIADRMRHKPRRMATDVFTAAGFRKSDPDEVARVDALLEAVALTPIASRDVQTLPLGSSRLVELGRSLAGQPSVLLLDEAFSGLDSHETARMADVLRQVAAAGVAILLIEHDVDLVLSLAQSAAVLNFGQVIAHGTPDQIRTDVKVRAAYLGDEVRTGVETSA